MYQLLSFLKVPIECIKEIRTGADARYYRQQFQLSHEHEDRWLTITYICDGNYKTLHIVAATRDVFAMWDHTLRRLYEIRKELMSGLGNGEVREAVWARQYWAGADGAEGSGSKDDKLDFEEVVKMCRRLNISSSGEELMRLFRVSRSRLEEAGCSYQLAECGHEQQRRPRLPHLPTLCQATQSAARAQTAVQAPPRLHSRPPSRLCRVQGLHARVPKGIVHLRFYDVPTANRRCVNSRS